VRQKMFKEKALLSDEFNRRKRPCGLFAGAKRSPSIAISILTEIPRVAHRTFHEGLEMNAASLLGSALDKSEALLARSHQSFCKKEEFFGGR